MMTPFEYSNWYNNPFKRGKIMKMHMREMVGRAWIGDRKRIIYSCKEIRRGKNKGKFWVEYLVGCHKDGPNKGEFRYKKLIVLNDEVILNED